MFLDVQMPGLDGMGVIRKLREKNIPLPYFVMASAYDQYAVEAFRWEALDYLLKPVEKDRLALAIERARKAVDRKGKNRAAAGNAAAEAVAAAHQTAGEEQYRNFIVDAQEVVYATIDDGLDHRRRDHVEGPIELPHH